MTESKECSQCGCVFGRRRSPSGRLEGLDKWRARRFCGPSCAARWQKLNQYRLDPLVPGLRTVLAVTCPKCGELLGADKFSRREGYLSKSHCMACQGQNKRDGWSEEQRETENRRRHGVHVAKWKESKRTAVNFGKEWTGPELEIVSRSDLTLMQMAKMLGRTYAAVSQARESLRREPKRIRQAGIGRRRA